MEAGLDMKENYKWIIDHAYMKDKIIDLFDHHHCLYICTYWEDIKQNIVEIWRPLHNYLHDKIRIAPKDFSSQIREVRKSWNHKLIRTPLQEKLIYRLQSRVFENLYTMPPEIINKYEYKMQELVNYWSDHWDKITWHNDKQLEIENWHIMHEKLYSIKQWIAHKLQQELKKKYY